MRRRTARVVDSSFVADEKSYRSFVRTKINFLLLPIRYLKLSFIIVFLHVLNLNLVHIRLSQSWFTIRGSITSLKRDTRGIERIKSLSIRIKSKLSKRSAKSGARKGDRSRGILETNRVTLVTREEEIKRGRQKVSFMTFTR